ncbi:MAG: TIGR04086 family membrane protein [Oscillospiraceae bacterium]|nr:TIGR04086 family membrane protein [Oscillospiraceae bacterium]
MKKEKSAESPIIIVLRGVLFGFAAYALTTLVASILVSTGTLPPRAMPWSTLLCALFSATVGGFIAARRFGRRRLLMGLAVGGGMFLFVTILRLIIDASGFPDSWTLSLLITLGGGGALGSVVSLAKRRHR